MFNINIWTYYALASEHLSLKKKESIYQFLRMNINGAKERTQEPRPHVVIYDPRGTLYKTNILQFCISVDCVWTPSAPYIFNCHCFFQSPYLMPCVVTLFIHNIKFNDNKKCLEIKSATDLLNRFSLILSFNLYGCSSKRFLKIQQDTTFPPQTSVSLYVLCI